jgi:hypothetical protein
MVNLENIHEFAHRSSVGRKDQMDYHTLARSHSRGRTVFKTHLVPHRHKKVLRGLCNRQINLPQIFISIDRK